MSIQPIPPTTAPTTAGQLVNRAYQNDQALDGRTTAAEARLLSLENRAGPSGMLVRSVNGVPADLQGDVEIEAGGGVQLVSGVVTPETEQPVHEYFTTGAATIDGVEYAAEQAVVLFRIAGQWVHRVIDLPIPPSAPVVTHLGGEYAASASATHTLLGFDLGEPAPGRLILIAVTATNAQDRMSSVTVAGVPATTLETYMVGIPNAVLLAVANVPEEVSGDIVVNLSRSTRPLISVARIDGASPVAYAAGRPDYEEIIDAPPPTVPAMPPAHLVVVAAWARRSTWDMDLTEPPVWTGASSAGTFVTEESGQGSVGGLAFGAYSGDDEDRTVFAQYRRADTGTLSPATSVVAWAVFAPGGEVGS